MWLLVVLACWNARIDELQGEIAALEEEIDELEDQVSAAADSASPDDSDPPQDTAPPELAPSVVWDHQLSGNSGSYNVVAAIQVQGDFDAVRLQRWTADGWEESWESCVVWDFTASDYSVTMTAEVWANGAYECWEATYGYPMWTASCRTAVRVDNLTCD